MGVSQLSFIAEHIVHLMHRYLCKYVSVCVRVYEEGLLKGA